MHFVCNDINKGFYATKGPEFTLLNLEAESYVAWTCCFDLVETCRELIAPNGAKASFVGVTHTSGDELLEVAMMEEVEKVGERT